MARWNCLTGLLCVFAVCGCLPVVHSFDPDPATEFQMVKVEGDRMTGAVIYVNTTSVGAAAVPAIGDPLKRRDIVMPDVVPLGAALVNIQAKDAIGSSAVKTLMVNHSPPVPPNFVIMGATGTAALEVDYVINGDGVYPGANATVITPFKGPRAWADEDPLGGPLIPASNTTFLWDRTFRIHFHGGLLTQTKDYFILIQNVAFYGGGAAMPSNNKFPCP